MKNVTLFLWFCVLWPFNEVRSQNLLEEKIRKVVSRKTGSYIKEGIFFKSGQKGKTHLNALRHFYTPKSGQERIVFEFDSKDVPKVYGYSSQRELKVYIDLFYTALNPRIASLGNSNFVKNLSFYPIDDDSLSMEMDLKSPLQMDVFYLENPGRLVIDLKI